MEISSEIISATPDGHTFIKPNGEIAVRYDVTTVQVLQHFYKRGIRKGQPMGQETLRKTFKAYLDADHRGGWLYDYVNGV